MPLARSWLRRIPWGGLARRRMWQARACSCPGGPGELSPPLPCVLTFSLVGGGGDDEPRPSVFSDFIADSGLSIQGVRERRDNFHRWRSPPVIQAVRQASHVSDGIGVTPTQGIGKVASGLRKSSPSIPFQPRIWMGATRMNRKRFLACTTIETRSNYKGCLVKIQANVACKHEGRRSCFEMT